MALETNIDQAHNFFPGENEGAKPNEENDIETVVSDNENIEPVPDKSAQEDQAE